MPATRLAAEAAVTSSIPVGTSGELLRKAASAARRRSRRYHPAVSRTRPPTTAFACCAGAVSLAVAAGACGGGTLDAGRNKAPDTCPSSDAASPACPPTLIDDLVGHWRLDDGAGSTVAVDSSGRGNDGVVHDLDPSTAWVAGRSQGALDTAHVGWVQVAPAPSIDAIVDRVTVAAWINLEGTISPDTFATALSRQIGTSENQHYHLSLLFDGRPTLFIATDVGYVAPGGPNPVARGAWTHLATVYDGADVRLYVNGAEVASAPLTGTFMPDTTPVILGGNGNDASGVPTELFPGRIDELMLYARALSADEIGQLAAGALFPGAATDAGAD
jgi:hypothetical protein